MPQSSACALFGQMCGLCACSSGKPLKTLGIKTARALLIPRRWSCACSSRKSLIFRHVGVCVLSPHTPMRPNGPLGRPWDVGSTQTSSTCLRSSIIDTSEGCIGSDGIDFAWRFFGPLLHRRPSAIRFLRQNARNETGATVMNAAAVRAIFPVVLASFSAKRVAG
jgi:hypothetical protein